MAIIESDCRLKYEMLTYALNLFLKNHNKFTTYIQLHFTFIYYYLPEMLITTHMEVKLDFIPRLRIFQANVHCSIN